MATPNCVLFRGVSHECRSGKHYLWTYARVATDSTEQALQLLCVTKSQRAIAQKAEVLWPGERGDIVEVVLVRDCLEEEALERLERGDQGQIQVVFRNHREAARWELEEKEHAVFLLVTASDDNLPVVGKYDPESRKIGFWFEDSFLDSIVPFLGVLPELAGWCIEGNFLVFPSESVRVDALEHLGNPSFVWIYEADGKLLIMIHQWSNEELHFHFSTKLSAIAAQFRVAVETKKQMAAIHGQKLMDSIGNGQVFAIVMPTKS